LGCLAVLPVAVLPVGLFVQEASWLPAQLGCFFVALQDFFAVANCVFLG